LSSCWCSFFRLLCLWRSSTFSSSNSCRSKAR
jgi:hypothetical protein